MAAENLFDLGWKINGLITNQSDSFALQNNKYRPHQQTKVIYPNHKEMLTSSVNGDIIFRTYAIITLRFINFLPNFLSNGFVKDAYNEINISNVYI